MTLLKGKIVFITGGAEGIGKACIKSYLKSGASVSVLDSDEFALNELKTELSDIYFLSTIGNVCSENDIKRALVTTLETFGKIDIIHNNVGIAYPSKTLDQTTEEEWDNLFNVNLKSIFWTTKYGIEYLKKTKGCILNTSSMVGEMGQNNHAVYVATKGGMNSLTKAMALDYAQFGIRVNAICPAGVWTPMLRKWMGDQPNTLEIKEYLNKIHALGYCPESDVIADVAVFLISDLARFITGNLMPISGGAELGYKK